MHSNCADFEIVGFDGSPDVPCDLALPIVRFKERNSFARFSTRERPEDARTWYEVSEFDRIIAEGLATHLPLPCDSDRQPEMIQGTMLAYVKDEVFCKLRIRHPVNWFPQERIALWRLSKQATWVVAGSQAIVMDSFETLARRVSKEILDVGVQMLNAKNDDQMHSVCKEVKDLAYIGLLAAKDAQWRQNFHILDGAARYLEGDFLAVRNLFDYVVNLEFPDWSWESYEGYVRNVRSVIETRLGIITPVTTQWVKKIAAQRIERIEIRHAMHHGEFDLEAVDRWKRGATELANAWKTVIEPNISAPNLLERLHRKTRRQGTVLLRIPLSLEQTLCLATTPFFWEHPEAFHLELSPHNKKPCLVDTRAFYRAAKRAESNVTADTI